MPKRTCSIEGCERPHMARGWCQVHYLRWKRLGNPLAEVRQRGGRGTCAIDDCGAPYHARGWCEMHYERWRRHGDPARVIEYPSAAQRLWAKVDKDGPLIEGHPEMRPCWIWVGWKSPNGYGLLVGTEPGKKMLSHRLAYELEVGKIPEGMDLDHLCHTLSDCVDGKNCIHRVCVNPAHLEPVTPLENARRGNCGINWRTKTHCKQGHPFDDANTYVHDGHRHCRECIRIRCAQYRMRKRRNTA